MVEIDEWIPNFEMFILIILPTLLIVTVVMIFVLWFFERTKEWNWMSVFKFASAFYLVVPLFRIINYIQGDVGIDDLARGLFVTDFLNYMILVLLMGIIGLLFIIKKKVLKWRK